LDPNQKKNISLELPIARYIAEGEKIRLQLKPQLSAQVGKLNQKLTRTTQTDPLLIGSSINFSPSVRYFTPGGDQLGRGPLPPRVGETTKYWIFVNFVNTTNEIQNIRFTGQLANQAKWTGKTSVSHGKDLQFNPSSNSVSWSYNSIPAHSKVGLYMQVGFTPTTNNIGNTPILLRNIQLKAKDNFTDKKIIKTVAPIDTSMPEDKRAQRRGIRVISNR